MKKICIIGSSGFIGKNIYDKLIRNNEFKIIRYSSLENKFLDYNLDDSFDILIFCSGLHPHVDQKIKGIFLKNKEILRKCKKLFFLSKKIIFFHLLKLHLTKIHITSNLVINIIFMNLIVNMESLKLF